jgi:molybdenum cofactor cytidylyltransferase
MAFSTDVSLQPPTVIVLASGRGERFFASGGQGSKLEALIAGKRVLDWTLSAVKATGLPFHVEDAGHPGMGDSIAAGVRATLEAAGWLILPGDLPLVQPETVLAVATALQNGAQAAYPVYQGERGHPVGFSVDSRSELLNLKGNRGAALVLSALIAIELIVNDRGCVSDVDTLQQLEALRNRVQPV